MFQLHDRTRRTLCLGLFVLFCLAPTAAVVAWAVAWHSPGYARSEAERLGWRLGMKVSLLAVRHPRPGTIVYEGLQLADPASGQVAIRCRTLEAAWVREADFEKQDRDFLALRLTGTEIEAGRFEEFRRLVDRALARRVGWPSACVRLHAGEVHLKTEQGPRTLGGVEGRVESLLKGTWAQLRFRPDPKSEHFCTVSASRDQQAEVPATYIDLKTGEASLPGWLLALGWSDAAALGPESRFRGTVLADLAPQGWSGSVSGQFAGIDLNGLVTRRFPHTLSGNAQLLLDAAEFRDGRLTKASGSLVAAEGGTISRSLLAAAGRSLGMKVAEPGDSYLTASYDQLGFWFAIDSGRLMLQGRCPLDREEATAAVVGRGGTLLDAPRARPLPLAALVETLAPDTAVQVAAGPQAEWLLQHLALGGPPVAPVASEARRPDPPQH